MPRFSVSDIIFSLNFGLSKCLGVKWTYEKNIIIALKSRGYRMCKRRKDIGNAHLSFLFFFSLKVDSWGLWGGRV